MGYSLSSFNNKEFPFLNEPVIGLRLFLPLGEKAKKEKPKQHLAAGKLTRFPLFSKPCGVMQNWLLLYRYATNCVMCK